MPRKLRIAVLTRSFPPSGGGIAAAHFGIISCLSKEHEIAVFAFEDGRESTEQNIYLAKTKKWQARLLKWLADRWIGYYAKGESATNCQRIISTVPAIMRLNKSIQLFQPDFILCPDNFVPALAMKIPKLSKLIWIAHHNYRRFENNPVASNYSWIDLQLAHRLERRAMKKADAIVAVSEYMAEVTIRTLEPAQSVHVIRNYINSERISGITPTNLRDRLSVPNSTPIIYIPAAGSSVKGERYTFEVVRRLGEGGQAAFYLSGDISSSLQFELKHMSQEIKIYAPGQQEHDQNLSHVAACDFAVSPALIENLSSALIESLTLGVPVVTFDVGGNKELIEDGVNGYLAPYLDLEKLISSACALIMDMSQLEELKKSSREPITEILSADRVRSEFNALFASIGVNE
jgi:glycosyltransferase involved in cell wall biosynthesis